MFHEVATLVHLIESSKPVARKQGRPLDRAAKYTPTPREAIPRLLERRPCLAVPRELNFWRDKTLHNMKIAGDVVLISAMSMGRLCRLDE